MIFIQLGPAHPLTYADEGEQGRKMVKFEFEGKPHCIQITPHMYLLRGDLPLGMVCIASPDFLAKVQDLKDLIEELTEENNDRCCELAELRREQLVVRDALAHLKHLSTNAPMSIRVEAVRQIGNFAGVK